MFRKSAARFVRHVKRPPFRASTVKSRAIAGSFSGAAAGSFMGFLGPSQFRIIPFQTSKLDKDNVGKVVPGCSIAEKSQRRGRLHDIRDSLVSSHVAALMRATCSTGDHHGGL